MPGGLRNFRDQVWLLLVIPYDSAVMADFIGIERLKDSVHELLISWMRPRHFRYRRAARLQKDGDLADDLEVTRAALRPNGVNE